MYRVEECDLLDVCPWCREAPELRSDGLGDHWVACRNGSLPSEAKKTCPVCPESRSSKTTLKHPAHPWSREDAIRYWNWRAL